MDLSGEASVGAMSGESQSTQHAMTPVSGLATPTALSSGSTCGGDMHGSIDRIDRDAFKISAVAGFPMAMATPYHTHKAEVSDSTRHDGS
jgi:hypothetical protein